MGKASRMKRRPKEIGFGDWVNSVLAPFEFDAEESTTDTLLRVARHILKPGSRLFFFYAKHLCSGFNRRDNRIAYSNILLQNVQAAVDEHNLPLAKAWLITFGLLMEEEIRSLIDTIHLIEKARLQCQTHDDMCKRIRRGTSFLVMCFYFIRDRNRLIEWLLKINLTLFRTQSIDVESAFQCINIVIANKADGTKNEFFITVSSE